MVPPDAREGLRKFGGTMLGFGKYGKASGLMPRLVPPI
jgi:hypothetical protein